MKWPASVSYIPQAQVQIGLPILSKILLTMPRIVKRVFPHREIARLFQYILYFQMNASCGYRDDVVRPILKLNLLFCKQNYPSKPC